MLVRLTDRRTQQHATQICKTKGLISEDRSNKATLILTIPRSLFKSSAKDLSQEILEFVLLRRVIVTPAVYPRLVEFLHFHIQSTGQKSHCVNTVSGHRNAFF